LFGHGLGSFLAVSAQPSPNALVIGAKPTHFVIVTMKDEQDIVG
jgi:hypothetical protein